MVNQGWKNDQSSNFLAIEFMILSILLCVIRLDYVPVDRWQSKERAV